MTESSEPEIRVVIMEDHDRLCDVLNKTVSLEEGLTCIGHYKTAKDTLAALERDCPDVVSLDLTMPDYNGLTVLQQIRKRWPQVHCIVFSGHADIAYVETAIREGARAYVFKEDVADFVQSIRCVAEGGSFISARYRKELDVDELVKESLRAS